MAVALLRQTDGNSGEASGYSRQHEQRNLLERKWEPKGRRFAIIRRSGRKRWTCLGGRLSASWWARVQILRLDGDGLRKISAEQVRFGDNRGNLGGRGAF